MKRKHQQSENANASGSGEVRWAFLLMSTNRTMLKKWKVESEKWKAAEKETVWFRRGSSREAG